MMLRRRKMISVCAAVTPAQNSLVETTQERINLLLDRGIEAVLYDKANILLFVIFRHSDIRSAVFEVDDLLGTELLYFKGEVELRVGTRSSVLVTTSLADRSALTSIIPVISFSSIQTNDLWYLTVNSWLARALQISALKNLLWIHTLQIPQVNFAAEDLLVECSTEVRVQQTTTARRGEVVVRRCSGR